MRDEPMPTDEDSQAPEADMRTKIGAPKIQGRLSSLLDAQKIDTLQQAFADAGCLEDELRVEDLRDPDQDHSWLFSLNPDTDIVLPEEE